ncbi:MAG: hypothetical protein SWX82_15245 [Cyanobacteriota bacterium]|nr:hypothetical protein [Cyanobacteriota bacterium]
MALLQLTLLPRGTNSIVRQQLLTNSNRIISPLDNWSIFVGKSSSRSIEISGSKKTLICSLPISIEMGRSHHSIIDN